MYINRVILMLALCIQFFVFSAERQLSFSKDMPHDSILFELLSHLDLERACNLSCTDKKMYTLLKFAKMAKLFLSDIKTPQTYYHDERVFSSPEMKQHLIEEPDHYQNIKNSWIESTLIFKRDLELFSLKNPHIDSDQYESSFIYTQEIEDLRGRKYIRYDLDEEKIREFFPHTADVVTLAIKNRFNRTFYACAQEFEHQLDLQELMNLLDDLANVEHAPNTNYYFKNIDWKNIVISTYLSDLENSLLQNKKLAFVIDKCDMTLLYALLSTTNLLVSRSIVKTLLMLPEINVDLLDFSNNNSLLSVLSGGGDILNQMLISLYILSLIEKNVNMNAQNITGESPVHVATRCNHTEALQLLMRFGADMHLRNKLGQTALHLAAHCGYTNIIKLLIEKGLDVNEYDHYENTPFFVAVAKNSDVKTLELFMKNGADIHWSSSDGCWTLLHIAAHHGCINVIEFLIEKGLYVNTKNKHDVTALHYAALNGNLKIAEILVEHGADIEVKDHNAKTPLSQATLKGHIAIMNFLISKGANLRTTTGRTGMDLMHTAAMSGNVPAAKLLVQLDAHVNINAQDDEGGTPLFCAVAQGHAAMIEFLLSKGADIYLKNKKDVTILHLAATQGDVQIGKMLMEFDAHLDVNVQTNLGNTPAHVAAGRNKREFLEFLLAAGARVDIQNNENKTLLDVAREKNHLEIVEFLENYEKNI